MKPQLPPEIAARFPDSVLTRIMSYVPHLPKRTSSPKLCTLSPLLDRELRRLQTMTLKGKSELYLRDLEDFIL